MKKKILKFLIQLKIIIPTYLAEIHSANTYLKKNWDIITLFGRALSKKKKVVGKKRLTHRLTQPCLANIWSFFIFKSFAPPYLTELKKYTMWKNHPKVNLILFFWFMYYVPLLQVQVADRIVHSHWWKFTTYSENHLSTPIFLAKRRLVIV